MTSSHGFGAKSKKSRTKPRPGKQHHPRDGKWTPPLRGKKVTRGDDSKGTRYSKRPEPKHQPEGGSIYAKRPLSKSTPKKSKKSRFGVASASKKKSAAKKSAAKKSPAKKSAAKKRASMKSAARKSKPKSKVQITRSVQSKKKRANKKK